MWLQCGIWDLGLSHGYNSKTSIAFSMTQVLFEVLLVYFIPEPHKDPMRSNRIISILQMRQLSPESLNKVTSIASER